MKQKSIMFLFTIFFEVLFITPVFADDSSKLVGTWKLVSFDAEIQATGKKVPAMGENSAGYVLFTPEGRSFFILTADGRKPAKTAQEKAALLDTMVSYTGKHRVEGDKWITKVELAWNPAWIGSEQIRSFKIEGDRLYVMTPWNVHPNWPERGMTRRIITFERAK
jgi:hypothetical protein